MNSLTKEGALKIVLECAEKYRDNLLGNTLLFMMTDKHKNVSSLEVAFEASNFLHLTGFILTDQTLTAGRFFQRCIDHRLSVDDFEFPEGEKSVLKLSVMPLLFEKNLSANMIGSFNGTGVQLYTEKIAGSVKGCLGFVKDAGTGSYVPNTILREDIRKISYAPYRVIATYRKLKTETQYSECVYKAKKIDWSKIRYPEEYTYITLPEVTSKKVTSKQQEEIEKSSTSAYTQEQLEEIDANVQTVEFFMLRRKMALEQALEQSQTPKELIMVVKEKLEQKRICI